jgi:aminopeptidase N
MPHRLFAPGLVVLLAACTVMPSPVVEPGPFAPIPYQAPLVDIQHYDVSVDIDHRARHVEGHVDILFTTLPGRPAERLVLDAVEMTVHDVRDGLGRSLSYDHDGRRLVVQLADPLAPGEHAVLGVDYDCYPRRGLYFVAPSAADPTRPWQIWTQGQTQETRHWIPVWDQLDDHATHRLTVTVDDGFLTMAAGTRVASVRHERNGRRSDTWEMTTPHAISLLTLVTGGLAEGRLPGGAVPLPVLAEASALPDALDNFVETARILEVFGEWTARPYPYPKYAQTCVQEFVSGGMENVSATTLTHATIHDPAHEPQISSLDLVAHEAAHQWFGNLIGCRDWGQIWLNEGFATYAEALYLGRTQGEVQQRWWMRRLQRQAVAAQERDPRPVAWSGWTDPDDVFDGHAYAGGATRLHLLSELLGADVFERGVQRYVSEHAEGVVTTEDLRAAMEAESGRDLERFFEEWLHGPGFPRFRVELLTNLHDTASGPRTASLRQVQGADGWREVFHLPVTVAWSRGGIERQARVDVGAARESLFLAGEGQLDWVHVDATNVVPGTVHVEQPETNWRAQLEGASDPLARLTAAEWLAGLRHVRPTIPDDWLPEEASLDALIAAARDDGHWDLRATAVAALSRWAPADDTRVTDLFVKLLDDTDPRLREAAAAGLGQQGGDEVLPELVSATEDANARVAAAALTSLAVRGYPGCFTLCRATAEATDEPALDSAVVRIVGSLEDEPRALPFLLAAVHTEPDARVRSAALRAAAEHPDGGEVVHRVLCESLWDDSWFLRSTAAAALGRQGGRAAGQLRARLAVEANPWVLEALRGALATAR